MSLVNAYSQSLPQQSSSASNTSATTKSSVQANTTSTTTGNPFLDGIRLPVSSEIPESKDQMLKQEDFFALLSQQLSMQDPFKPVDNDQMIAQMASFSTVDGISNLNDEILNLNTSDTGAISTENSEIKGVISTPSAIESITVRVEDESGQLIKSFIVDGSKGGNIDVTWDGLDKNGDPAKAGNYAIKASGKVDGTAQDLAVSTYAHVTSVSLGTVATGAILNLRGVGGIKLSDVLAVSET
jgi:flagellar basal-body rod modification protein FlgD